MDEIFTEFSEFVHEYETLILDHPITGNIDPFTKRQLKKWPVLTDPPINFYEYLEEIVNCLHDVLNGANSGVKARILHHVFNQMDACLIDRRASVRPSAEVVGKNKDLFIKPARFWKTLKKSPPSSSALFKTFGVYESDRKVEIISLDDLLDEATIRKVIKVNPLDKKSSLMVGLFPLSEIFLRSFVITRQVDSIRNTFGFLTNNSDIFNQPELDIVLNIIDDEKLDIACFPELLITDDSLNYLTAGIKRLNKSFFILIAGSDHRPFNQDGYKNSVPVIIFYGNTEQVCSYSKSERFYVEINSANLPFFKKHFINYEQYAGELDNSIGNFIQEDIVPDEELLLLTSRRFGDMGFVICKDFLSSSSKIMRNYCRLADHLFIISLNFSQNADFKDRGSVIKREFSIALFYINAKSFDPLFVSPTFYLTPEIDTPEFIERSDTFLKYQLKEKTN